MAWISSAGAVEAIGRGTGAGVRVAVIDSGVERSHPALAGCRFGADVAVVEENGRLTVVEGSGIDAFGHGTAVAGIIHESAPMAEIVSVRVLDGSNRSRSEMICEGARWAIEHGCHILNCSFGARMRQQVLLFKDWIDRAYVRGRHVVAACNNDDFSQPEWPGDFTSVITVNMLSTLVREQVFRHAAESLVEFAAHGVDVSVAWKNATRAEMSGSSFAAPRVSALIARLLSLHRELTPVQVKAILQEIALPPITHPGLRTLRRLHYSGQALRRAEPGLLGGRATSAEGSAAAGGAPA